MESSYVEIRPHFVENLPYVVLTKRHYEILCEDSGYFGADVQPVPIANKHGEIAYYLLPEDHFNDLSSSRDPEYVYFLSMKKKKVVAKALFFEGHESIEVIKGSSVGKITPKLEERYRRIRHTLEKKGIIVDECFTTTYRFTNPSEAARVVAGCPMSGNVAWVNGNHKRLCISR